MRPPKYAQPEAPVPIVYNPASGGGRGKARFKEAENLFALRDITLEPVETEYPGHATELARSLAQDHDLIYIMGGDGTLSEASEGILTSGKEPLLGFIPAGTGNDFLRDHGFTDRPHAIDRITMGRPMAIDAATLQYEYEGQVHKRHWINLCGSGFAAQAGLSANKYFKWARSQAYNLGVLAELIRYKATPTRLWIDGEERQGDYPMVVVCNNIHTGGAMKIAPMARVDDGLLDVLTIEGVGRAELVKLLTQVREGTHVRHEKVHFERAKKVRIEPARPSPLNVDGEILGATPVDIEVLPGALQVLL